MKALRYLLIVVIALVSVAAKAEFSQASIDYQFRSTSMMTGSGSTLPQAALTGTMYADGSYMTYGSPSRPRRAPEDGDTPPSSNPKGPMENPIGDGMWVLMVLALGYAGVRYRMVRGKESRAAEER